MEHLDIREGEIQSINGKRWKIVKVDETVTPPKVVCERLDPPIVPSDYCILCHEGETTGVRYYAYQMELGGEGISKWIQRRKDDDNWWR